MKVGREMEVGREGKGREEGSRGKEKREVKCEDHHNYCIMIYCGLCIATLSFPRNFQFSCYSHANKPQQVYYYVGNYLYTEVQGTL